MRLLPVLVLALAFLSACASTPVPPTETVAPRQRPLVILIGVDGFRADYLNRGVTPTLSRMAQEGVRAQAMRPSFPTVTFPNFYTLATGLRPDRHGLVGNTMRDSALPGRQFSLGNRTEATDRVWYDAAEPIWVTGKRQGLTVATMFWPGSEAAVRGVRPDYWLPFEKTVPSTARTNILLGWLSLPEQERPTFATLYFDIIDVAGHRHGPDSDQVNAALAEVDAAIAALVTGLEKRQLSADIVVVADHGMAALAEDRVIFLDDLAGADGIDVTVDGPYAVLDTIGPRAAEAEAALLSPHEHFTCWRKSEVPARYGFGANARIAAIVCLAEVGWQVTTRARFNPHYASGGGHGYDPFAPEMSALFLAQGPSFKAGATLDVIDNVDVYPLLTRLLGIEPAENQGDAAKLAASLR